MRSDSSPSTTSQPSPAPALPSSCGISPPTSHAGSRPSSERTKAIIPVVVVFPCAPATTIARRRETSSARKSARRVPATGVGARDDGLPAVRHDGLGCDPHLDPARAAQIRRLDPVPAADLRTPGAREERVRREPGAADADEPEAPTRERPQARSAPPRSRRPPPVSPSSAWPRSSPRAARGRRAIRRRARERGRAPLRARPRRRRRARSAARSASGDRRWRAGTGRGSRRCPTRRAPRPCRLPGDREIGRGEGGAEVSGRRDEDVVVPVHPAAQALVVALARDCSTAGPSSP